MSLAHSVHRLIKTKRRKVLMINLTLEDISIGKMNNASGLFIGDKNTVKKFNHTSHVNEAVGVLSGNKNTVKKNQWIKNREKWEVD